MIIIKKQEKKDNEVYQLSLHGSPVNGDSYQTYVCSCIIHWDDGLL